MRSTRRFTVLGAAALALTTVVLGVQPAGAAAKPKTLHYFEKPTGFTYIPAGGKPIHQPPSGPPKPGDRIEISGNLYKGDHKHHGDEVVGTDHTICVFNADLSAYCDAQAAFGGSMLLVHSSGGDGDFTSTITGGTGRFLNAKGTVRTHPVKDNADLTIRLK
ncbi:hypothetical protein ACFLIM_35560 [Nonomuraea sp. M3C6]|uniref:Dirigent-like protein n=1 Tax=Nonomuraea marmarensis TaxID=3351344 RepID=A0ABW7AMB1_9ACTN